MEIPSFLKHIITGEDKPKVETATTKKQADDFEALKIQALEVLNLKITEAIKKAKELQVKDFDAAEKALSEAERLVEQGERVKFGHPLIDELEEIVRSSKESKIKGTISEISGISPEGKEIKFELREQAKYWNEFYKKTGVDWVEPISEEIKITEEDEKEMIRLITELGFNKMLIIPDNMVGQPEFEEYEEVDKKTGKKEIKKRLIKPAEHYEKLHELMSKGKTYQDANYKEDGGFGGSKDSRKGFRIILTREVQNLEDDELFKQTLGESVEDLEAKDGLFEEKGVCGLTEAEYLILQRDYFINTGKHLDGNSWTWLPSSRRPFSGRVPDADWNPGDDRFGFGSSDPDHRGGDRGCRFAGNFSM